MNEIKHNWQKWLYWFALGVALICIYKILDNYENVMKAIEILNNQINFSNMTTPIMNCKQNKTLL